MPTERKELKYYLNGLESTKLDGYCPFIT